MSQRRRFYDALSWMICIADWGGLEHIEAQFDKIRGHILAEQLEQRRPCDECTRSDPTRVFDAAFSQEYRIIE